MTRHWVPPLGITGVWSDVDHLAAHPRAECRILPLAHTIGRGRPPPVLRNQIRGGVKGLFAAEILLT